MTSIITSYLVRMVTKMMWILVIMLSMRHSIPTVGVVLIPVVKHLILRLRLGMMTQWTKVSISMVSFMKIIVQVLRAHVSIVEDFSVSCHVLQDFSNDLVNYLIFKFVNCPVIASSTGEENLLKFILE